MIFIFNPIFKKLQRHIVLSNNSKKQQHKHKY